MHSVKVQNLNRGFRWNLRGDLMFKTIRNAFKVKELREKILYTLMMLVVIRFGCQLPIPGIETTFFKDWFAKQTADVFGFF